MFVPIPHKNFNVSVVFMFFSCVRNLILFWSYLKLFSVNLSSFECIHYFCHMVNVSSTIPTVETILDDIKDNIWTLLEHIRSYYTISDQFGQCWTILYHLRQTLTILDHFSNCWPFWTILEHFGHLFNHVEPV